MEVSVEMWERLHAAGSERRFEAEKVVLRQGDPPTHVLLLVSGRVKVSLSLPGGEVLLLALRGVGELIGEIAVLGGDERSATVVTIEPCVMRMLPADRFRALVRSSGLETELLQRAMRRIREGEAWRAETAALPAGPRVVRALVRLAVPGRGGPVDVGLGQSEIGQAVGLSRSVVAAELGKLRDQGIVRTARRRIVITDPERLRALAESGRWNV
ncbi:Crp/Fnr family transcriptional regulator [Actinomadura rugatobispora]|uniref:Crp/Fnr family transcriptional regulator n=1 Tax=Actinomadura rugatobispora TaxID=1994 RepID=A0ABW0ZLQ9_9ACTN|nr:Crp/Fnr family transcriptional regulator [Actinomadura rugatobispora]